MNYYVISSVTTTDSNGRSVTHPDIPDGTPFVGSLGTGDFLIATPSDLSSVPGIIQYQLGSDLQTICMARGLEYTDVLKWNVGGS